MFLAENVETSLPVNTPMGTPCWERMRTVALRPVKSFWYWFLIRVSSGMDESSSTISARALVSLRTLVMPSSCMIREDPTWYICLPPIWMLRTEDSFVTVPSDPRMSNRLSVCTAMELPVTLSMTLPRASKVWIVASRPANSSSMLTVVFWRSSHPVSGSVRAVVSARVVRVFLRFMVVPFSGLWLLYGLCGGLSINVGRVDIVILCVYCFTCEK